MKSLKIILLILILTFSFYGQTATVITTQSNIRETPSTNSKILAKIRVNVKLKLLSNEHVDGWYFVLYGKIRGWVHGNNIEINSQNSIIRKTRNNSRDEWIYYAASSTSSFYYNPAKTIRAGSNVRVWTKEVSRTSYSTEAMEQLEFNCQMGRFRSLAGVLYNSSGTSYRSWDKPKANFITIIPETVVESLYKKLCR